MDFDMTAAGKKNKTYARTSVSLDAPPQLPCDLVEEEILWRLPVKNLRQLCCVWKSWNSLISHGSKFAKKHLRFSILDHDRDRHHLTLRSARRFRIWKSPISSLFSSEASLTDDDDSFTQLSHPLINNRYDHRAVSTCHGLFCLGINKSLALLCNPSIRKFKELPPLDNSGLRYSKTFYTIVYDRFIDNYKTIAVSSCPHGGKREVNVHTFGTDYWRKIQDFPYHYLFAKPQGIFVNDTVNWLICGEPGLSRVIVSLDLEKESYQDILQPLYDKSLYFSHYDLVVFRDCLCVSSHSRNCSDIWIMKEYGNENSWTKLLRVPYIGDIHYHWLTKPLYIYEDDRVLMRFFKMKIFILAVYDSKNNTFKTHQIQNSFNNHLRQIPQVYVESLMSPY